MSGLRLVPWIERLPLARERPAVGVGAMLVLVLAAFVVREVADQGLPPGFPFVTFFPAVIITSFLFGVRLGAASAALCGVLAWYFFVEPRMSLELTTGAAFAMGFYVFVVATDLALVHWMQSANAALARERETSAALAETRELLFRELQHRISNNLQVTAALLALQRKQLSDPEARGALDQASRRLELIGRISRQLYDPSGQALTLLPFLDTLCRDVLDASGRSDLALSVVGDADARLEPDAAIPTALIVAESVANAVEHGFAGERSGRIEVRVDRGADGKLTVSVEDDGHGLPSGFDHSAGTSLGLRIATMLARSRGGTFDLSGIAGTRAVLTLPAAA